ncbi:MAG: hypothetical protein ABIP51_23765 [Bacteroidia bacterium]
MKKLILFIIITVSFAACKKEDTAAKANAPLYIKVQAVTADGYSIESPTIIVK